MPNGENTQANPVAPNPCRYCGENMANGASLCKTCNSYQRPWRNDLRYWSGIAGLITLIVSGLTFSLELSTNLYDRLFGADLAVSDFKTSNVARLWNTATVDIWVTGVRFDSSGPTYSVSEPTSLMIENSKVGEIDLHSLFLKAFKGKLRDQLARAGDYATDLTIGERSRISEDLLPEKDLVAPDFILRDGPEHRHLKEIHKADLFGFPCTFVITYRRADDSADRAFDVPCFGTLRRLKQ